MDRTSINSRSPASLVVCLTPFLIVLVAMVFRPPIPQSEDFHAFADRRTILGVPNFLDVVTNLPFLAVGLLALANLRQMDGRKSGVSFGVRAAFAATMLGTFLGSSFYHLKPTTERLVYDRLPLAMLFGAIFLIVVEDRAKRITSGLVLSLVMAASAGSVLYWAYTESIGAGDLRPYIVVQFGGIFSVVATLIVFRRSPGRSSRYAAATFLYAGALLCQHFDHAIFGALGHLLSGHSLKHLFAAGAAWMFATSSPGSEDSANS